MCSGRVASLIGLLGHSGVPSITSKFAPISWRTEMSAMSTSGVRRTLVSLIVVSLPFSSSVEISRSPTLYILEPPPMPLTESLHDRRL